MKKYISTWNKRKERLGEEAYQDYLKSEEWRKIKLTLKNKEAYKKCRICRVFDMSDLHHLDYNNIKTKNCNASIIPVCRDCHSEIHKISRYKNITVANATSILKKDYNIMFNVLLREI